MAVTPSRNMRVDDERWSAWEVSAAAAGVSITKLVVMTMDNAGHSRSASSCAVLAPAQQTVVVSGPVESERRPERKRSKVCPHRIPETSYCRHCDGAGT